MKPSLLRLLAVCTVVLAACGGEEFPQHSASEFSASAGLIAQTCNNSNIRGQPAQGTFCGGSTNAFNCSPGIMYKCTSALGNNCTISSLCASGCITGGRGADACFTGTPALVIAGTSATGDLTVPGGTELSATVSLSASHPAGSIVNVKDTNVGLVAARAFCNVPDLAANQTTATFGIPTALVTTPQTATLYADIAYNDTSGQRELVSRAATITLTPGGTLPPPAKVTQLTMTPSTIEAGGVSFAYFTLDKMAPAANTIVDITSSDLATAGIFDGGDRPVAAGGCTSGGGLETILASNHVPANKTVTISAAAEGSGQVPATAPLTVTAGCSPLTCVSLPMPFCQGPDGCGGTLACGCSFTGVCGGGGPGICGDPTTTPPPTNPPPATPEVSSIVITPASTTAGTSVTGTVTISGPAGSAGATVGLTSSGPAATVPASVKIPAGLSQASFTIATSAVTVTNAPISVTISAALGVSQSTTLTVNPKPVAAGAALTVSATGRSGVIVNSSPAGIAVGVGSSATATFPVGTSITLTPSGGRTAVWSGACSSSKDTKSCTFTLTGAASVTAAVK